MQLDLAGGLKGAAQISTSRQFNLTLLNSTFLNSPYTSLATHSLKNTLKTGLNAAKMATSHAEKRHNGVGPLIPFRTLLWLLLRLHWVRGVLLKNHNSIIFFFYQYLFAFGFLII